MTDLQIAILQWVGLAWAATTVVVSGLALATGLEDKAQTRTQAIHTRFISLAAALVTAGALAGALFQ